MLVAATGIAAAAEDAARGLRDELELLAARHDRGAVASPEEARGAVDLELIERPVTGFLIPARHAGAALARAGGGVGQGRRTAQGVERTLGPDVDHAEREALEG